MEFFNVIEMRRSVRQFVNEPVPRNILQQIVNSANQAPTGCNEQIKQYIIIDDPAVMDRIRFVSRAMNGAPAAIAILVEEKPTSYGEFWAQDASAALMSMLLSAVALGYAGCWVEGALRREEQKVKEILAVPDNLRLWSITPIGKPANNLPRPTKPMIESITHYNRYNAK